LNTWPPKIRRERFNLLLTHTVHSQKIYYPFMEMLYDHTLTLNSTLADLPTQDFTVSGLTQGQEVAETFRQQPELRGVIIVSNHCVIGVLSRRAFFEQLGQLYGVSVYMNRPIIMMLKDLSALPFILSAAPPTY
jgi:hypothetical protein